MTSFIDTHCHLDKLDSTPERAVKEAKDAGVKKMLTISVDELSLDFVSNAVRQFPEVYGSVGFHPHDATVMNESLEEKIRQLAQEEDKIIAIGETGLDFYRNYSSPKEQKKSFEAHLEAAIDLQIPLFLHVREAHKTFFEMLNPVKDSLPKTVVHCFTGSKKELIQYIEMNFYIGLTGWICDERRGGHLKELVHLIPSKKLLCETDAPYLIPRDLDSPNNGRNEPKYLPHIVNEIASNLNEDRSKVANRIYKNSCEFFDLDR